ncbi:MAG: fimbria/pilus periplasmic chaperone [Cetobacterium sp.]|uniref:fimbria/pilus periplasmic chaperone n=1 Tax=Cetobacterium sp. ZWU0022 TaxID=1340502 RepID=UPI00064673DE|nr:fimbria/pilus periplasmic chaperone [Cetobacterium sp. ZWU0022]
MRKKSLLAIMFFLIATIGYAFNFSVAPTRFEIVLDKVNTNEITLINNTTSPMRLESFLESAPEYEKYSLNDHIKLYPKMIAIKPGGKQIVRFRVKPEGAMESGEYKSYVVFKEIPLKEAIGESGSGVDAQIKMITEVGISIYGYYGEINKGTNISNLKISYDSKSSNLKIVADSDSKGNSSELLNQKIEVLGAGGLVSETIEAQFDRTKRSGKSKLESSMRIEGLKGKKVRVTITDTNGKIIERKTTETL